MSPCFTKADGAVMHHQAVITLYTLHVEIHSSQRRASVNAASLQRQCVVILHAVQLFNLYVNNVN